MSSYPLSALQEGMIFDTLLAPDSGVGIEQVVLEFDGRLDAERLQRAWQQVTDRHDALRTSFRLTAGGPIQDVWANVTVPFEVEDVLLAGAGERAWYVEACAQAERRRGFSAGEAPLQRIRLLRLGIDAQVLIWTNHHAIFDGRARTIVLRDIVDAYAGRALQRPFTPYRKYIRWLQNRDFRASEAFWSERLRGFIEPTPLPVAFAQAAAGAAATPLAVAHRTLSLGESALLAALARDHDLTITSLVQAAWALLLSRYAAAPDVVFGAVRASRQSSGDDASIVGPMITTPPLRIAVDDDAELIPWLRAARARWTELREHEHVPHRAIAKVSEIRAPQPLFESLVVYERDTLLRTLHTAVDPRNVLGIRQARIIDQTNVPLTLAAAGTAELDLRLQVDTGRYGQADAERLLDQFVEILREFPRHAHGHVRDISLLPDGDDFATGCNRTTEYPRDATVPALFAEQTARTPDAVALTLGNASMTYGELSLRAGGVAAELRRRGIARGAFVGLSVERSFDMVAALLGILACGAASIAIDRTYPDVRLTAMLAEAGVDVILAQSSLIRDLAPVLAGFPAAAPAVVALEELDPADGPLAVDAGVTAEDGAHVMYTSGSTGIPKGAVIPHRAVVRTVRGTDYLRFTKDETFFAFVPLTFDVAILELWGPLLNGGRLVLCPPGTPALDVLASTIEAQGVTTLWLTTALFEQMVDEQLPRLRGLRQLIVGGDVMSPAHARRALAGLPATRLVNVYGPTEATVLITAQPLLAPPTEPIPLGAPIPNATVYVLDPQLRPVPVGVPGEIYTGGDGLALGYLNRPDLTAERFLPDPFSIRPGATMYRTGDLGRWRPDGAVDFLGRVDTQVKIRGLRIELGAIESALTSHPGVREAVVIAAPLPALGKQLVAYVVPRAGEPASAADIRAFLGKHLARHMVPAFVVFVESLPRTATGKFDRKALPDPGSVVTRSAEPVRRAPQTAAEIAVAAHVAETLGVEDIALDDDFYAFGGDSLRAMRLVSRLREAFRVNLSIRDLVAAPTVAGLTAAVVGLERETPGNAGPRVHALRASGSGTPVFFLHGDLAGGGYYCGELARHLDAKHPLYVVDPHGTDGAALPRSIEAMARENVAAILALYPGGPVRLGGFCNGGIVAYEMARQLAAAGVQVEEIVIVDGFLSGPERTPFAAFVRHEARLGLARFGLLRSAEERESAGDGNSWDAWHDRLVESWYDALARYAPGTYNGPIALLWSDESAARMKKLMDRWFTIAPDAASGRVPGAHLTSITRHLVETSRILAGYLQGHERRPNSN